MPNERSAALVDDLFGIRYVDGKFVEFLDINAVVNKTKINSELLANEKNVTDEMITALSGQLEDVVAKAKEKLAESYRKYKEATDPLIDAEVDKLAELEEKLDESRFVRISRFELVNIRMISGFDLSMAGTIKVSLKDGTETWVARRYVRTIQEKFMSINQGGKDHE